MPTLPRAHYAPLPLSIQRGGLAGPRLTTVIAYLKGVCHASFSTIRKFIRDVIGLTISRGQLAKIIGKVSRALERPYEELLDQLPAEDFLNVDETGHKQNRQRQWTWCFRAELYTLFKIDPTRSGDVLIEVLGTEFDGVLGCDYFSAYRRYHREFGVALQFCLAHLIRDVKYPDDTPRCQGSGLWRAVARGLAVAVRGDPSSRGTVGARTSRADSKRRGPECCDWGRPTCRRRGPASTWPSDSRRMGRATSGSSRLRVWDRRTIWRNKRSGSW